MPQAYDFSHHLSPSVAAGVQSIDIPSPVPPIENLPEPEDEFNSVDEMDTHQISAVRIKTVFIKN